LRLSSRIILIETEIGVSVIATPAVPRRWRQPPLIKRAWLRWLLGMAAVIYLALALGSIEMNWARLWRACRAGRASFPHSSRPILRVAGKKFWRA